MRFALSDEQKQFAAGIGELLSDVDTPAAARAWAIGDHEPGLKIWRKLGELGVTALAVPEHWDGVGGDAVDLVVAFEQLGYGGVPGPWVDTVAVLPALLDDEVLTGVATGDTLASIVLPPHVPYALDADVAHSRIAVLASSLYVFTSGQRLSSVDTTRRLFEAKVGDQIAAKDSVGFRLRGKCLAGHPHPRYVGGGARALDAGALATAAQLLGAGQWLLDTSVGYAKQRKQYGREIGQYQAVKHLLADVVTKLELARPLVHGAAVAFAAGAATTSRDVSAAKVAAADAAYLAARTGLQVHGAIGYTAEHTLGLWLTKVRALVSAWGTQAFHRSRVLEAI